MNTLTITAFNMLITALLFALRVWITLWSLMAVPAWLVVPLYDRLKGMKR